MNPILFYGSALIVSGLVWFGVVPWLDRHRITAADWIDQRLGRK